MGTHLVLHGVPYFLLVLDDLLVMRQFQLVKFVHLALEHRQRFAEALQICEKCSEQGF